METKQFLRQTWVKDEIKNRLIYNPNTGELSWAFRDGMDYFNEKYAGRAVGCSWSANGYIHNTLRMEIKGRKITLVVARLCWLLHYGDWPENTIDHIDRNPLNNKIENLRDVTQAENNRNRGSYKGSVFRHLRFHRGIWSVNFKGKYIGGSKCFGKAVKIRQEIMRNNT